jgi:hypothetical protein
MTESTVPRDPASSLPAALRELLARERLAATRADEVTALWRRGEGPRRTFRIELAGGGCAKGRTHRNAEVPARMARWIPLAPHGLAAVRASGGAATLEEWVDGEPLEPHDEVLAEEAGALLGALHAVLPLESVRVDDRHLADRGDEARRWLEEVRAAGRLTAAATARVDALLRQRPRAARWGLYHGDFSPENLVVEARRVRCVDNTTVRPEILEVDLGFSFNRWPLDGTVRERFLRGYRRHADPALFLANEPFWRIHAALRSAAYRIRESAGDPALPLGELARLVA